MKKYWFIIETYVFLWKKESSVLVFRSVEQPKTIRNIQT